MSSRTVLDFLLAVLSCALLASAARTEEPNEKSDTSSMSAKRTQKLFYGSLAEALPASRELGRPIMLVFR